MIEPKWSGWSGMLKTSGLCGLFVALLFMPNWAIASEFNTDGNREGWQIGHAIESLEVVDGSLVATVNADTNDPYINGPFGPWDADRTTGIQFRMRWSFLDESIEIFPEDFTSGPEVFWFPAEPVPGLPGHGEKPFSDNILNWWPEDNGWFIVYVDLLTGTSQQPWQGMINNYRFDFADNVIFDYKVEIDWVRLVNYWVENNNFEEFYFSGVEPWEQIGAGSIDDYRVVGDISYSEFASLEVTGLGSDDSGYHALEQEIFQGTELEKGSIVSVVGAYYIPAGSWNDNSTLWFRVRESDGDQENLSPALDVTEFDQWVEFSSSLTLDMEPGNRESLSVQLFSKTPAGTVFYLDDVFVDVKSPEAIVSLETFPDANWEFNTDGDNEGWASGNQIENIEAGDGVLSFTYPAGSNDPFVVGPAGPYPGPRYNGAAIRMRVNTGAGMDGPEMFWFPTEGGHGSAHYSIPANNEWFTAFIDVDKPDWRGEVNNIRIDFANSVEEEAVVEIDWIRFLDEHIQNNSFESGLEPWVPRQAEGSLDKFVVQSEQVYSGEQALRIDGVGSYQAIWQVLEGYNTSIPQAAEVTVKGAYYVPEGTEITDLWVRINEKANGVENLSPHIEIEQFDTWVQFEESLTLSSKPQEREWISIELFSNVAADQPIYLDDIFVTVFEEPREQGWPINAVRLEADQQIAIDGEVSADEYAGAQVMVVNSDTLNGIEDPYFEDLVHGGVNPPNAQQPTSLDDFNGTYFFMWDDENFYAALSAVDDEYNFVGPDPNGADALQFVFAETPDITDTAQMFIPTLAIDDGDSNMVFKNNFNGWLGQDLAGEVEYAGKVGDDANYAIEIRIPWDAMQGGFENEVFPPVVGDMIGFCVLSIDYDGEVLQWFAANHTSFPWSGNGVERIHFIERETAVMDWSIY